MIITLTGFMGCGKSTVGRILCEKLGWILLDTDAVIEEMAGKKIEEIFRSEGEAAFRQKEAALIREMLEQESPDDMIISLGGGAVCNRDTARIISDRSTCIYLKATTATLLSNLRGKTHGRPLLESGEEELECRIGKMLGERSRTYEEVSAMTVVTDGRSAEDIAMEIISRTGIR